MWQLSGPHVGSLMLVINWQRLLHWSDLYHSRRSCVVCLAALASADYRLDKLESAPQAISFRIFVALCGFHRTPIDA